MLHKQGSPIPGAAPRQPGLLPGASSIPIRSGPCFSIIFFLPDLVPNMEWAVERLHRMGWECGGQHPQK